jgi:cobalamin biosynthesis Co2+ chelatase CbiK
MRDRKLRCGVNWKGALKQKGLEKTDVKQGLGEYR